MHNLSKWLSIQQTHACITQILRLMKHHCIAFKINLHVEILRFQFKCLPHHKELYMQLDHDRFFGFLYCNDQVLVQYSMQFSHAFPKAKAFSPLQ